MDISVTLIMALSLCVLPGDLDSNGTVDFHDFAIFADNWLKCDQNGTPAVTITLTELEVTEKTLELSWNIKNDSGHDIWICEAILVYNMSYDEEVYLDDDDQTLVIRRRLDVPTYVMWYLPPGSTYVRLHSHETSTEAVALNLPVHSVRVFQPKLPERGVKYARRVVVEIGYHTKDLPREARHWEPYPDPDAVEQVVMDYYNSAKEGEHVLRITVDGVLIPYEELWAEPINTQGTGEGEDKRWTYL
jgi:hypothetical protein